MEMVSRGPALVARIIVPLELSSEAGHDGFGHFGGRALPAQVGGADPAIRQHLLHCGQDPAGRLGLVQRSQQVEGRQQERDGVGSIRARSNSLLPPWKQS